MKRALLLVPIYCGLCASQAIAETLQPPLISVSGSAEVKVAPDEIYLRVGVETRDEDLQQAKKQNDEKVSKALAYLKRKVEGKHVQTDFMNVDTMYDHDISRTRPVTYVVRKSIEVKLTKVENFEEILTGLLSNGVNHVLGIDFRTSELRKHRDQARALAIRAAREKADSLAAELGVKPGKVYRIDANEWGGWWSASGGWGGRYGGGMMQNVVQNTGAPPEITGDTLSLGQISVSATVNVSFLIE